jgi:hypothetical protein
MNHLMRVILSDERSEESKDLRLLLFTLPQKLGAPHLDSEMWDSTNLNQRVPLIPFLFSSKERV